jgi:hypothetical protein
MLIPFLLGILVGVLMTRRYEKPKGILYINTTDPEDEFVSLYLAEPLISLAKEDEVLFEIQIR